MLGLTLPFAFVQMSSDPWVKELSRAFKTAIRVAGLSQKSIAIDEQTDEAHFSQQLNSHGLNFHRLMLVKEKAFWRVFIPLLCDIVDCADLLVNPIAGDAARHLAREIAALHAELKSVRKELSASQREKVTA